MQIRADRLHAEYVCESSLLDIRLQGALKGHRHRWAKSLYQVRDLHKQRISCYRTTGLDNGKGFASNRFSFYAACSSSALALHDAVADLSAGRCDYAMVGGASSILRPATSVAFNKLHMLSPDGSCKSFSAAANG